MRSLLLVLFLSSSVFASPVSIEEWDDDIRIVYLELEMKIDAACAEDDPQPSLDSVLAEAEAVASEEQTDIDWRMSTDLTAEENMFLRAAQEAEISYRVPMWDSVKTKIVAKAKCKCL